MSDAIPTESESIEHLHLWYRSITNMRRRVFETFASRPANFVDPLAALHLFGPGLPAPVEFVYPHSTNVVYPGSHPVDSEILPLPKEITDAIALPDAGTQSVPKLHERTKFRGTSQISDDEANSWQLVSSFLRPFCRTVLYSHDPHVVVGRMSWNVINALSGSKVPVHFLVNHRTIAEVKFPRNYFQFYQIKSSACDLCTDSAQYTEENLRSISSLSLRSLLKFQELLTLDSDTFAGHLRLRDWSEYRLCRKCFKVYFPERVWRD